jgi:hypothetical protein
MEDNTETPEFLVITDQAGTYYAIPVGDLEAYLVSEPDRDDIERLLEDDVHGYSPLDWSLLANPMVDPILTPPQPRIDPMVSMVNTILLGAEIGAAGTAVVNFVGAILNLKMPASMPNMVDRIE